MKVCVLGKCYAFCQPLLLSSFSVEFFSFFMIDVHVKARKRPFAAKEEKLKAQCLCEGRENGSRTLTTPPPTVPLTSLFYLAVNISLKALCVYFNFVITLIF